MQCGAQQVLCLLSKDHNGSFFVFDNINFLQQAMLLVCKIVLCLMCSVTDTVRELNGHKIKKKFIAWDDKWNLIWSACYNATQKYSGTILSKNTKKIICDSPTWIQM